MNSDLTSFDKIEQKIGGSRKISNYIIGGMLTIGGIGFLLASIYLATQEGIYYL